MKLLHKIIAVIGFFCMLIMAATIILSLWGDTTFWLKIFGTAMVVFMVCLLLYDDEIAEGP
ncbi:hypothetical protein [Pontibacter burrus]|uniref:Uncharacterized protein n=1 Tax=Pontibacter burrus TaxID=2704466 RepID=A0A6B3LHU6_9BACT|nr:hypothetical protein [Pontibacter burrus]NEM96159.1 hypothetical protein [Pontibacter burrus]